MAATNANSASKSGNAGTASGRTPRTRHDWGQHSEVGNLTHRQRVGISQSLAALPGSQGVGLILADGDHIGYVQPPLSGARNFIVLSTESADPGQPTSPHVDHVQLMHEMFSAGLSCGGAVVSGLGVVGTAAIAPETGGASLLATGYAWSSLVLSSFQCGIGVYRVFNEATGRHEVNEALDESNVYQGVNLAIDVFSLGGAGKTGYDIYKFDVAADRAGFKVSDLLNSKLNSATRRELTRELELKGAKRVATDRIRMVAKQRVLDAVGVGLAVDGSADGGVFNKVMVKSATVLNGSR